MRYREVEQATRRQLNLCAQVHLQSEKVADLRSDRKAIGRLALQARRMRCLFVPAAIQVQGRWRLDPYMQAAYRGDSGTCEPAQHALHAQHATDAFAERNRDGTTRVDSPERSEVAVHNQSRTWRTKCK